MEDQASVPASLHASSEVLFNSSLPPPVTSGLNPPEYSAASITTGDETMENSTTSTSYFGIPKTIPAGVSSAGFFNFGDSDLPGQSAQTPVLSTNIYKKTSLTNYLALQGRYKTYPDNKDWMTLDLCIKKHLGPDSQKRNIVLNIQNLPLTPSSTLLEQTTALAKMIIDAYQARLEHRVSDPTTKPPSSGGYKPRFHPYKQNQ